jgi:hypothetical protein
MSSIPPAPARPPSPEAVRTGHQRGALVTQGLHAVGVGEDRQVLDQDLGGLAQRGLRVERPVGLDVDRELVVVGLLADAGGVHGVRHALDRREDRVDRDHADRLVRRLVVLRRRVAAAVADREVHLELGLLLERAMRASGLRISTPEGRSMSPAVTSPGPVTTSGRLDLGRLGVHAADDLLEVQDDVRSTSSLTPLIVENSWATPSIARS